MSWNSLLKNLTGEAAAATDTVTQNNAARNENLSGRAFKKQLQESPNAVLLDVRTAGEFAGGTIPGSLNIDFFSPDFMRQVERLDKNATYFLFCRSGNRSGQACRIMHSKGFDVRNLAEGIGGF